MHSFFTCIQVAEKKTTGSKNVTRNWMMTLLLVVSAMVSSLSSFAQPLTGTKNVPVDYPTLAAAITDLNLQGVGAGGVTISVTAGNPQTAPTGGYSITTLTATLADQIIITGNGNTITAPTPQASGNLNDAIFKIIGSDYVTLQGFTMQENAANTTTAAATNNMTEWGVAVLYATTTNGAQNITIQNNTISLNRTYQNTFGIYSNSTHSATAPTTAASATTTAGSNSGLIVYNNAISNVNNGIVVVGPTAAADYNTGIDIGGSSLSTANTLTNYGTTGTFSAYANVSGTVYGILVRNATGFNVSYNSVTSSNGGVTAGTLRGIYIPAFSVAPTGTFTNSINNNTVALTYGVASGTLQGITVEATTGTATATQNINDNNFTALTGSIATSATTTAISCVMANLVTNINNNKLTNITTNTSGAFTFIGHGYTVPAGGTQNINGNSIVTAFSKTGGAGALTMMSSGSSTIAATTVSHSNNNFSNITVTGTSAITGISSTDGLAAIAYGRTVTGNTMSNWTAATGAIIGMSYSYWGGVATLSNNTITNLTGQGAITGIVLNASGNTANPLTISGNTVSDLISTGTGGAVVGIGCSNTSPAIINTNNLVHTLSSTGASAVTGISSTGASTSINIFKNKVYDLSGSNASSTINGILVSTGTVNIYNNFIGDLRAPVASAANPVIGLSITGGTTMNVVYNTIYLNATSSGAIFGSSAISVSSTPATTLGNNVLINTSTPNTTGFAVAYRRSSTTLTSYQNASNKNILYAGTPGPNNLIFYDGTNADQTINAFKTRVGPTRDALSFSENPTFLSTTGSSSNFLHVNPAVPTLLEGNATVVAGITDDFDGDTRNVSTPDIGADEFAGIPVALHTLNSISINPTGSLCTAAGRTVTANVTIGDNPVTSITLNYSFNGGASVPVTMTGGTNTANTTSDWTGTIPVGTPADANVTWNVTTIEPLMTRSLTGAAYRDEPFTGSSVSITSSPANPVCAGAPTVLTAHVLSGGANVTLGTGATTSTTYSGPFYSLWNNKHLQMIVKASELQAAGLGGGNITALTYYATTIDGVDLNLDFSIKMANTAATDMTNFVTTGLVPVFSTPTFSPVVGANLITFSSPFTWDGTSNVVVEICFGNPANTNTLSGGATMDATSYVSTRVEYNTSTTGGPISGTALCGSVGNNVGTYSTRPHISFTGVGESTLPGYVWNDGTSNIGSTNPLTVYPLANTSYTVTGTDVNGCTITSLTPYTVTTVTGPTPPSGTNSTQCGLAFPTAFVISNIGGDGTGFRWYNAEFGGTLLQTGGGLFTTSMVSTTTTFWVSETNGTCESLRTPVTVTVTAPDAVQASVNNNSVCLNTTVSLSAANIAGSPVNTYTYSWTASPEAGSGITGSIPGSPLSVQPTTDGTYTYTVTAIDGGCTTTATVSVTVKPLPVINSATATPAAVCSGVSSTLTGFIGSPPGTSTIGTATATLNTTGSVYRTGASSGAQVKSQYIVSAAELTTAGMTVGSNINSLGFTTTSTTGTNSNMEIYMGHTSATLLTTTFLTSSTQLVYSVPSFTPVPNSINTHVFSTPFLWDGVSNILIEVRHVNQPALGTSTCSTFNPGFVSNLQVATATGFAATTGTTSATRPIMTFNFGNDNTANYNWEWNPGALTGSSVSVAPIVTTTYTATATDPVTTCSGTNTVTLTIYDLPAAPSGNNSDQCGELIPAASVSSNSSATTPVFRWYDAASGGNLLQTSTSNTYLQIISVTTDFYVAEVSAEGCEGPRTLVTATVGDADPVTALVDDNTVCPNSPISLSATQTGTTNTYVYTWTASPTAGSGIPTEEVGNPVTVTPTTTGTYTYTVTAFDFDKGCTDVSTVVVTVNAPPVISSAAASPATVCSGSSTTLTALTSDALPGFVNFGTQTTTIGGNDGNPYRSGNGNGNEIKTQLLVTAAELTTAGLSVGNITSLGFTTTGIGGTIDNFIIKMGHTTATALTTTFETPTFTTVFTQPSFTTVLGLNTHVFSTPFNWDGTSNIVIEICQVNAVQGTNTVAAFTPAYASNTHKATSTTSCTSTTGTAVATKPIMRFGGLVGSTGPGTYSWTWNPGNLSGNSVSVSPTSTTTYTATATDAGGCVSNSSPVTVTVLELPNPPIATPSTQCGLAVPTASVATGGANGTYKWYSAQTGGTLLQTGGSTYTTAISTTTSFWVSESDATCESPRTEVVVTVTQPDAITAIVDDNSVCSSSSIQLSVSQTGSSNTYSYTWTANPATGSGIPTSVSGSPVTVTPTVDGTYTYTVTGVDASGPNTCTVSSTISVTVNPNPVISSVTATPTPVCAGSPVALEAQSLIGTPLEVKLGTGTSGFTGAANPYWNSNSADGSKFQFLYKATDLQNIGLTAGNISGIKFKVTTNPIPVAAFFNNYSIAMSNSSATALTATWQPGMQTVMNPINHVPVTGDNTYTFDTPFAWDGVSNIVIQVCYDNDPNNTCTCTGATLAVEYTASQSYASGAYYYETNSSQSNRDMCASTAAATTQTNLPNVTFLKGASNNTSLYNWVWNPGGFTGAIATVNPTTTTTYTATATNPTTGCVSTSDPVTVTVNPVPVTPTATSSSQCGLAIPTASVSGAGGTYNWYSAPTGGTLLQSSSSTTYLTAISTTTTFYVAESNGNCESGRVAVVVTVNSPDPVLASVDDNSICPSQAIQLSVANTAAEPINNYTYEWSASPVPGSGMPTNVSGTPVSVTPTTVGTYTYTVVATDNTLGCVTTSTVTVTVNPNPVITSATATPATLCAGGNSTLAALSIPATAGTATVGTGSTTTASYNAPFYSLWSNKHMQILVKASELTGAGLTTGNITNLTFYNTAIDGVDFDQNFSIKMAQSNVSDMSAFVTTGFTEVYSIPTYVQVVGANLINLNTPFAWDGTSNIVLDICFGNPSSSATLSSTATADATSYVSVIKTHTSAATAATTACPDITSQIITYSVRPRISFGGQIGVNNTASYNWIWNPGNISAGTTGSTTVNVSTTTTYTATATNPTTGCTSNSDPVTVTVTPVMANATATPSTPICAGASVTLNANAFGGAPFTYAWSDGTATVYPATATISVTPAVTTTYTVTVTDACSGTTTSSVTVTVNPLPTSAIQEAGPITLCFPATQVLTATSDAASPSYQWTLNGTNIPSATNATYTVSGVSTGTYRVIVTNTVTGCISAPSTGVVVTINQQPTTLSISPLSATICAGSPQALTASGGTISTSANGTITGTPTSTASTTGSPYRAGGGANYQIKQQMLVKASELNAMGIPAATSTNLTSISFTTPATASGTFVNFEIKIGHTALTALTSTFVTTPMTTVFTLASYSPVANSINTHTFSVPFAWDGVSNIVVETRQTNSVLGTAGVIVYPPGYTSTVYSGSTTGFAATTGTTSTSKPVMGFGYIATIPTTISWSPSTGLNTTTGASVTASPEVTTTYTAIATSSQGCSNIAQVTISTNPRPTGVISGGASYCFGAGLPTQLSVAVTGSGPWSGTLSDGTPFSGSSSPILVTVPAVTSTTVYTIATLSDALCASTGADLTGSATVTINPLAGTPTASVLQPTCVLGTGTITVTAPLGAGNTYSIGGPFQSSVTFAGVAPGTYTLSVQNSFGCFAPATASVTVDPQPFTPGAAVVSGPTNVCPFVGTGEPVTFTATAAGATAYNWVLPPNVAIVSGQGTGTLVVTFAPGFTAQANKQLRVTASSICGNAPQTIYYLLAQFPNTPGPITGPTDACPLLGNSAVYTVAAVPGAASYVWTAQPGTTIVPAGPGTQGNSVTISFPLGFTTSAVTVQTQNDCGVSGIRSLTITRNNPSTPSLISGPTNICANIAPGGTPATYTVTNTPGTNYTWTVPVNAIGLTGQGTNTISFTYPAGFTSGVVQVMATNGCGSSGTRSLSVTKLNPATPSVIDVIQTAVCPERVFTYTLAGMPANATSVQWTVPTASGAVLVSGQGTISITVSYPATAVQGVVTAQAVNNCGVSVTRESSVKLPACPPPTFTKGTLQPATTPVVSVADMQVDVFPNPTVSDFKLRVLTASKEIIHVRVLDAAGRAFKQFTLMPYETMSLGKELRAGAYIIEVRQGKELKSTKVLKF